MNVDIKIDVPESVLELSKKFKAAGKELFLVGGAVRDAVLGNKPHDFDLATDALPEEILSILEGHKTLDIGESFGIIMVVIDGEQFEIATFREDIGKGRRPDAVKFTTIENDVKRRDLTINALFYNIEKEIVVDLVGGIKDLTDGIINTVGNAQERFDEDALRKLRAFRFATKLGYELSDEVTEAILENNKLPEVSFPRIRDELIKSIQGTQSPKRFLNILKDFNMFELIFPGLEINNGFIDSYDWTIQLASLLRYNDARSIKIKLNELTYSSQEIRNLEFLYSLIDFKPEDIMRVKKLQRLSDVSSMNAAYFMYHDTNPDKIKSDTIEAIFQHEITTSGDDPELKDLKGKEIGDTIRRIEAEKFMRALV